MAGENQNDNRDTAAARNSVDISALPTPPPDWRRGLRWFTAEFLVVVSGILVALALQAWWNDRLERTQEHELLQRLQVELIGNRNLYEQAAEKQRDIIAKAQRLLEWTGPHPAKVDAKNFESLTASMITDLPRYRASTNELDAMLGSGKLALLRTDDLRAKLAAWKIALVKLHVVEENIRDDVIHDFYPYLLERIPIQKLDLSSGLIAAQAPSRFESDYQSLLRDVRFENHVENRWALAVLILEQMENVRKLMDETLQLIQADLDS